MSDDYTFGPAIKDPAEDLKVELDLFGKCANFWRPNERYTITEYVRSELSPGFAYQATIGGTSGSRPPVWPRAVGQNVADGSVQWTATFANANGLNAVSNPSGVSDPTGLTISGVAVSETTKILATYSGGTEGNDYDAVFTFTLNGVTRVARQTVKIRKR